MKILNKVFEGRVGGKSFKSSKSAKTTKSIKGRRRKSITERLSGNDMLEKLENYLDTETLFDAIVLGMGTDELGRLMSYIVRDYEYDVDASYFQDVRGAATNYPPIKSDYVQDIVYAMVDLFGVEEMYRAITAGMGSDALERLLPLIARDYDINL